MDDDRPAKSVPGGKEVAREARRATKRAARDARRTAMRARLDEVDAPADSLTPDGRLAFTLRARAFGASHLGLETSCGTFVVDVKDDHIGRGLWIKRARPEFRVLHRAVTTLEALLGRPAIADKTFVEVGANIGTSTVPALARYGFGRAVAFEPDPGNVRLLRANLALNGLEDRVRVVPIAVSAAPGTATFVSSESCPGMNFVALDRSAYEAELERLANLADETMDKRQLACTEVELTSLDRMVADGVIDPSETGMVWMDAEGHEGAILRGASTLTALGVPMVMEFHPQSIATRSDLDALYSILERDYTHLADVRRGDPDADKQHGRLRPIDDLRAVGAQFSEHDRFTDLLVVRLPEGAEC